MKKILVLSLLCLNAHVVNADTFATLPNKAGGKIVLTDEPCVMYNKHYDKLKRAYNYGTTGYSTEGCWGIEGETITMVWHNDDKIMRYPMENFTLGPKYKTGRGSM